MSHLRELNGNSKTDHESLIAKINGQKNSQAAPDSHSSSPGRDAQSEILRRADGYLNEHVLPVDYYRIRRRLVFPLKLEAVPTPEISISNIPVYPWATWYAWALEERIFSLGWAAQWTGRADYSSAAARDLAMLASWPCYRQYESPDLCMAHFSRTLWAARSRWSWLPEALQTQIDDALGRIAEDGLPLHCAIYGEALSVEKILQSAEPHSYFHNIRVIGSIGAALAAMQSQRVEAREILNRNLRVLTATLLELRAQGLSEDVCYNGYVLDFLTDWLTALPRNEREELLSDARWSAFFEESLHLSAPGDLLKVAPLGDVEPEEMPFHISAQAKLHHLQRTLHPSEQSDRDWYLRRLNPKALRADALAALFELSTHELPPHELPAETSANAPSFGATVLHHAISLRSGWESGDVAVAVAASNSPMGHVRANYGSLCIGSEGNWFIQTPGYQQYIPNSEREFTIGKSSRNTPLLGDCDASIKSGKVLRYSENKSNTEAVFDLTACYTSAIELHSLVRRVQLMAHEEVTTVLVEDRFSPGNWENVAYYWHAHPDAAWWVQDGFAMLYLNGRSLWISSPQAQIEFSDIQRLRGSRGQMTLVSHVTPSRGSLSHDSTSSSTHSADIKSTDTEPTDTESTGHIQWLFSFSEHPPQSIPFVIQGMKNHQ